MNKVKSITLNFGLPLKVLSIITLMLSFSKIFKFGIASNYSWIKVLSPLWVPIAIVLGLLAVIGGTILFFVALCGTIEGIQKWNRRRKARNRGKLPEKLFPISRRRHEL